MNNLVPAPAKLKSSLWSAHRRRPAFLIILVSGLALFFLWLPESTRASLWLAFRAQREMVALLFIFALVTLSLIWSAGQRMDARVFRLFNTRHYPLWLDRCMWLITQPGNMLAAFLLALVTFLLREKRLTLEIVFGTLTLWLLVEIIKSLVDRERPFLTFTDARVVGRQEKGDSFPSGHTSQIFFLTTLMIRHYQPGITLVMLLYALAALVGFTRIYVGAHYPRDVIAGLILGTIWGMLAILIEPYWIVLGF